MDDLQATLFFLAMFPVAALFSVIIARSSLISEYEILHGDYAVRRGPYEFLRGFFRFNLRQVTCCHDVFISFKADPDEPLAIHIADMLEKLNLNVVIFKGRLENTELVQNAGRDTGIRKYLRNAQLRSSVVVFVASRRSFDSFWVVDEFTTAMMASDLVLLLSIDGSPPETLVPHRSLAFQCLLTSPVFAIDARDRLEETASHVARLLSAFPSRRRKFRWDLISTILISCSAGAVSVLIYFTRGQVPKLYEPPGLWIFAGISFLAAAIVPCRQMPPRDLLIQWQFRELLRGRNVDLPRLNAIVLIPVCLISLLFFLPPGVWTSLVVFVCMTCMSAMFELLHYWVQMSAICRHRPSN